MNEIKRKNLRKKILNKVGIAEEDLQKILNMKEEDLSPEYREIFDKLTREMPPELLEEIRKIQDRQNR